MSKAALTTPSRNLANQLGPRGITVNTVAPGPPRTATLNAPPHIATQVTHAQANARPGPTRTASLYDQPDIATLVTNAQAIERIGTPADIAGLLC